jgi:signal transduction histidine kinase
MTRTSVGRSPLSSSSRDVPVTPSLLAQAIVDAAIETCASITESRQPRTDDLRRQMEDVVRWVTVESSPNGVARQVVPPPVVAQEYVHMLRTALLGRLASFEEVDGRELVRALSRLDQLCEASKQSDRGRFVSRLTGTDSADAVVAVAHDIRSPLTSILILVDSLRRGCYGPGDPARDRQLGIIYGAAQGLSTLASDLIDAARGEQLSIGPAIAFSVTETMSSVAQILDPVSEERSIPMRVHPPEADGRIGHPAALQRVLLNLASNALRCTESGSVSIACVELTATRVEFSVSDTGPGIPADVLQRLYDGFSTDRLSLRFSRAGLGLAIVRTLLDAMGSALEIETAPGQGARFSFQLDLAHAR